jgi:Ca2+-binding RTX toxin-like protein
MAISASFNPIDGVLTVLGDNADNTVTVIRDAAGDILVNGGAVPVAGGTPTVGNTATLDLSGKAGNDTIALDESNGALPAAEISGGAGNDMLTGGSGNDRIFGGAGNDTINGGGGDDVINAGSGNDVVIGGRGNDTALLGSGNDTFVWNPGDGSDIVEGQGGFDTLLFNGANIAEHIEISANGSRALFTRDIASIAMDLNGIERIQFNALGGADNIVVNDLSGTDVKQVAVDLSAPAGSGVGDGAADTVTVNATAGAHVSVAGDATSVTVSGLAAEVTVTGAEPDRDKLVVDGHAGSDTLQVNGTDGADTIGVLTDGQNVAVTGVGNIIVEAAGVENVVISGGAGNDMINASGLISGLTQLTIDGGAGDDLIVGSQGADLLKGGAGDDTVIGGRGNDTALLGNGNDTFVWNPGDGSDIVEGQGGFDTLLFNGANIAEHIEISANGSRALFTRDIANIAMDLNGIERIQFNALGGADNIVVNDLKGTDVKQVVIDLAGSQGGTSGDGAVDTVTVSGNGAGNQIAVTASGTTLVVSGLSAQVTVDHVEATDRLIIHGGAGNDTIDASAVPAGTAALTLAGGAGNDVLIGGGGNDTFLFTFGEGGHDAVQGFQVHGAGAQGDVVALSGFADQSFAQAVADGHIAQSGADVAISDGTHVVATLQNVLLASLHANDFAFS